MDVQEIFSALSDELRSSRPSSGALQDILHAMLETTTGWGAPEADQFARVRDQLEAIPSLRQAIEEIDAATASGATVDEADIATRAERGDWQGIVRRLDTADLAGAGAATLVRYSVALARAGEHERSIEVAMRVFEADPREGTLDIVVQRCLEANRPEPALSLFEERRAALPSHGGGSLRRHLAALYLADGRGADALANVADGLAPREIKSDACLMAQLCAQAGDWDGAFENVEWALRLGEKKSVLSELVHLRDRADDERFIHLLELTYRGDGQAPLREFDPERVRTALQSDDLDTVRGGISAVRAFADYYGHAADLSRLGFSRVTRTPQPHPVFDALLERWGDTLGLDTLLDLFAGLFNQNTDYHDTRAALTAARHIVASGSGTAQAKLVDAYIHAYRYFESGHRGREGDAMDALVDDIFVGLGTPALHQLVVWAYRTNDADNDHYELLDALSSRALDDAQIEGLVDAIDSSLASGDVYFEVDIIEEQLERLAALVASLDANHPLGRAIRSRLMRVRSGSRGD